VIWLATSLLLTDFAPTEHEQAPALAISPTAAPETSNVRTIERAISPPRRVDNCELADIYMPTSFRYAISSNRVHRLW
jgi:hypothetical protein